LVVLGILGTKSLQKNYGLKIWWNKRYLGMLTKFQKRKFWRYNRFLLRIWERLFSEREWIRSGYTVWKYSLSSAEYHFESYWYLWFELTIALRKGLFLPDKGSLARPRSPMEPLSSLCPSFVLPLSPQKHLCEPMPVATLDATGCVDSMSNDMHPSLPPVSGPPFPKA
jgi:hypothetical protein